MKGGSQDPKSIIGAQESSNINTALIQQLMNMGGYSSPFGTLSYNQTGSKNVGGHQIPTYQSDFQLSDWGKSFLNPELEQKNVTDALYNQATSRLDPQWNQRDREFKAQLANQGIPLGSDAYDRAYGDYNHARNDAYTSANNAATATGVQAAGQQYNEKLGAVGQILAAMRGVGPQTGVSPTDVSGIYNNAAQQQQAMWGGIGNLFGDASMMAPFFF